MNPRRLLVALLAALLLSGGVTYILTRRINRRPAPAQTTQKYVAASRPLQAGEVLKPENLTLVEWPAKMPLEGVYQDRRGLRPGRDLSGSRAATGPRRIFGGSGLRNRSHGENPRRYAGRFGPLRRDHRGGRIPVPRFSCGCAGHLP